MKYILIIIFIASECACHPSRDYFNDAHEGFERNEEIVLFNLSGYVKGDSASVSRTKKAMDSCNYFRGAEDYCLKMKYE